MPTFVCDYSLCFKVYFVEYKGATSAFCCFPFSWNIFCVFTFSLCVLRLVWVSYRQHRDAQSGLHLLNPCSRSVSSIEECSASWNVLVDDAHSAGSKLVSGCACWRAHTQPARSWFLVALQPLYSPSFCSRSVTGLTTLECYAAPFSLSLCIYCIFCFVVTMRLTCNNLYL